MMGELAVERVRGNASSDHKIPFLRQNDRGAMRRDKMALAHVQLPPEDAGDLSFHGVGRAQSSVESEREDHQAF